jgi:hypothetical protein
VDSAETELIPTDTSILWVTYLVLDWESWVNRRVETITILDEHRIRRHVSMDFSVPADSPVLQSPRVLPMPVTMLKKEALRNFNIYDESSTALPVLTAPQNAELSTEILLSVGVAGDGSTVDRASARQLVTRVTFKRPVKRYVDELIATAQAPLLYEAIFRSVATEMATSFLLVAILKVEPGQRRVVKYEYEGPLIRPPQFFVQPQMAQGHIPPIRSPLQIPARSRAHLLDSLNDAFQGLRVPFERREGLLPFGISIPAEGIGRTRSYHLEVPAPEGLTISTAILQVVNSSGKVVGGAEDRVGVDLIHLHLADRPAQKRFKSRRGQAGTTSIRLRPRSDDVIRQAYVVSTLTTGLIWAGLVAHWILHVAPRLDSVAAVVVAIPAIYAVYLAAPAEHRLVQEIVTGIRDRIWVSAGIAFIAGAILTVDGLPSGVRSGVWELLALFSALNAFLYRVGMTRSRRDANVRLTRGLG